MSADRPRNQPEPKRKPDAVRAREVVREPKVAEERPQRPYLGGQRDPDNGRRGGWRAALFGAAALALAGLVGLTVFGGGGGRDQAPTPAQRAEIEQFWQQVRVRGVELLPVPASERAQAYAELRRLGVPEQRLQEVQQQVERGTMELVTFVLWDNAAEDGDVVELQTPELTVRVPLLHARATIPLVRPAGGVVNIRGVQDGGGGITLGIVANGAPVLLPPLSPGQVLGIPVR